MSDLFAKLSQIGTTVRKPKGEHVFRQGDKNRSIYFIKSGLLKAYYLTLDGKEQVKSLLDEGSFIASMTAVYSQQECSFSLSCLADSELLELEFSELKSLASQNLEVAGVLINGLLDLAMKKERREFEFLCLTAEDRYQILKEQNPNLLERVTQNDIARYLGITPVALSRIKKRISA